jgi:uncharacterized membrane protein YjjP (DUF1212 family)
VFDVTKSSKLDLTHVNNVQSVNFLVTLHHTNLEDAKTQLKTAMPEVRSKDHNYNAMLVQLAV